MEKHIVFKLVDWFCVGMVALGLYLHGHDWGVIGAVTFALMRIVGIRGALRDGD